MSDDAITTEPVEISKGEKKDLLDLVTEQQSLRATNKIPLDQIPGILLPYQSKYHLDMSNVRLTLKSRRIGWSWGAIAAEGTLSAAAENGMNQYYMGYNMGMAAENIGDAATFARAYGMVCSAIDVSREREVFGDQKKDITKFKINFPSGHVYEALSSSPWNWRGRQGHARIDEAAFHRSLKEVIKGAMAFLMWGGRVDIISTYNGEDNDFYELVQDVKKGRLPWSYHYVDFDMAIAQGFYKRICLVTGKTWSREAEIAWRNEQFASYPSQEDANEELLCIAKRGSGAYFSRLLIEQCFVDDVPSLYWSKPADWVTDPERIQQAKVWMTDNLKPVIDNMDARALTAYGQDFGRSGDLSVTWVFQKVSATRWKQAFSLELHNIPFDVQALIRDFVLDNVPLLHHATFDARGNGQSHAEGAKQKKGAYRVTCLMATQGTYGEWYPKYRQALEDRSLLIGRNEDVVIDHRRVILRKGNPTMDDGHDKGSHGEQRHGDSATAGLTTYISICADGGVIEFNPIPSKEQMYWDDNNEFKQSGGW